MNRGRPTCRQEEANGRHAMCGCPWEGQLLVGAGAVQAGIHAQQSPYAIAWLLEPCSTTSSLASPPMTCQPAWPAPHSLAQQLQLAADTLQLRPHRAQPAAAAR